MAKRINFQNTFLLFSAILVSLGYYFFNHPTADLHILASALDRQIPLVPFMAIPYILFVPIFWLIFIYAYLTQNKQFKVLALTIIIVHLISYLFYVFYQTHIPRPSIHGTGFALDLVRFIYSHDAPYNGFPSLHSALAAIMAMYFVNTRWGILYIGFALVVVLSTLFIKQHFIADAVAGVLLGVTIYLLVQHKIYNKSYERK